MRSSSLGSTQELEDRHHQWRYGLHRQDRAKRTSPGDPGVQERPPISDRCGRAETGSGSGPSLSLEDMPHDGKV